MWTQTTDALASASVVLTAAIICAGAAGADPSQDDQFVALLEQEQIPPVDNVPALVARANHNLRPRVLQIVSRLESESAVTAGDKCNLLRHGWGVSFSSFGFSFPTQRCRITNQFPQCRALATFD